METNEGTIETNIYKLASRFVDLISLIIKLVFFIVIGLIIFYCYLLINSDAMKVNSALQLQQFIQSLAQPILPYVISFAKIVAPVFILLFSLGILHNLAKKDASPFELSKLFSDLPSMLALLIIATICLLPLAGLEVPTVLNNIALVVVGFYFGKRKIED